MCTNSTLTNFIIKIFYTQTIAFTWKKCKDNPQKTCCRSFALNGKVYVRGIKNSDDIVLEYMPDNDQWVNLPPPPVKGFSIATVRGQLLAVGGIDKSTYKKANTIFTFEESSQQWDQSYATMPTPLTIPAVTVYHDYLIIAGGRSANNDRIPNVNILHTISNKWKTAEPLPNTDFYLTVLIDDTIYLVDQEAKSVFCAHMPTLITGAKSSVWEKLPEALFFNSPPVAIGNTLVSIGGCNVDGIPTTSIQMYNPAIKQWIQIGELPEPMSGCCITVLSRKQLVCLSKRYVYVCELHIEM